MQSRIEVSIADQVLKLFRGEDLVAIWPVSTSIFGTGTEEGSFRTPTGRFRIGEKIGAGAVHGTVFRSRLPTAEPPDPANPEDLVVSRILWLEGLEAANSNTRSRYIYIHGTNHEEQIGQPASHGCVRMRSEDAIALFDQVEVGDEVLIG